MNLVRKSLQVEIGSFTRFLDIRSFSKQAFSQARKKLSPTAFKLLNEKLVTEFYTDNDFKTFKGLRILAIDGSILRLPDADELYGKFGLYGQNRLKSPPLAKISTLYDVLNNITIHATMAPYLMPERDMARENINALNGFPGATHSDNAQDIIDLILFDRGYPSGHFMFFLLKENKQFLMRIQNNSFSAVREIIKNEINDSIISIPVLNVNQRHDANAKSLFGANKNDILQIRVLIFHLSNNEKEVIVTSLIDQNKFTYDDIFKLYHMRWNIEENYKLYKCIADLENFSGRSTLAIEQDFYATVFTCNIASLLAQEAQEELEVESLHKARKYDYKINRNVLIGTIKDEIIEVLLGDQNLDEYCTKLKKHIKRSLTPIRPGRSYPRVNPGNIEVKINKSCL